MSDSFGLATRAARASVAVDPAHGALMPPLYLSSTFAFAGFDAKRAYDYTRSGNPTRDSLAAALADLEGGAAATITSSGMAAITLLCHLLEPNALLLAPHDCYGGTHRLLSALARKRHFRVAFADFTDATRLAAAFAARPAMVLIETPSNPLLRITDIEAVCRQAHACGAIAVADNTFLSPVLQRPFELGADIVVHSTTKYLNGHSDIVGGAVISRDRAIGNELAWWANCLGVTGAPFDSYLALRGLRTLGLRIREQERNTRAIVELLASHPAVTAVHYPGLVTHPGHEIAARQQRGFGAIVSFELAGGTAAVRAFLDGLTCLSLAESLGGVESLVAHPATMTHAGMDPDARRGAGVGDSLLRLSVGIEDVADLERDLRRGLDRALAAQSP
ncbi:MAG TPA: cystathionine gamma-synthase [Gammaproteobacteria bacterium]